MPYLGENPSIFEKETTAWRYRLAKRVCWRAVQESCAITKMTARCALYKQALGADITFIVFDTPSPRTPSPNIRIYLIFLDTRIIGLHIPLIIWVYHRWIFSGGLRKTFLFLQEWRFGRSRSFKVIDFGTNWKHVCDFLLVRHSNLGLSLHRFGDIAGCLLQPVFHPNLGVFALHQIARVGVSPSTNLKLISREIIFEVFQPMLSTNVTDGRYAIARARL